MRPLLEERSIARDGSHELEVRKSRFICTVWRVTNEEAARSAIASIRKSHWDANHHCTAWRIGAGGRLQRSSDDGKPAGAAGVPMLEVLNRRDVTDVVAIVARYFGGIKLGKGGLIRAYGAAVSQTIERIGIVERRPLRILAVTVSHTVSGRLEHILRNLDTPLQDVAYNATGVTFTLHIEPERAQSFSAKVAEQPAGRADVRDIGIVVVESAVDGRRWLAG